MFGDLSLDTEKRYGQLLAPFLNDEETLFVISSDFCHWGERFDYTPQNTPDKADTVEAIDKGGMEKIAQQEADEFFDYCVDTGATICGRHPIGVLLQALEANNEIETTTNFVRYKQNLITVDNSSVSYASSVTFLN